MRSNLTTVIAREFNERVAKKSFIITTILMPVLMVVLMIAPALIMGLMTPESKTIAVIDESGIVYPELKKNTGNIDYLTVEKSALPLDSLINNERFDGVFVVKKDVKEHPENTMLYLRDSGSVEMESVFDNAMSKSVENARMKDFNIENLDEILEKVKVTASVQTVRISEDGKEENISSTTSMALGIVMAFVLYMFLIMYGQMVMISIIEEKNNRVLELIVSSVKPMQLMLGKIIGVGLVAVLQIVIWGILLCSISAFLMPLLMPDDLAMQVSNFNTGNFNADMSSFDPEMIRTVAMFSSAAFIAKLFFYMTIFMIGGFLFYAAIFAAIGSAVDSEQDASQLTTFAILPIIVALVFAMGIGNDPNSTVNVVLSMIPFTSPMVMLARIPFGVPGWEVLTSFLILMASVVFMAWFAGKIYRIGIFMYGKKPKIKDLIRWARYK